MKRTTSELSAALLEPKRRLRSTPIEPKTFQGDAPPYILPSRPSRAHRSEWTYVAIILVTAVNFIAEMMGDDTVRHSRFVILSLAAIGLAAFAWYECRFGKR